MFCLLSDKKNAQKISLRTTYTKKPFGYRMVHYNIDKKKNKNT